MLCIASCRTGITKGLRLDSRVMDDKFKIRSLVLESPCYCCICLAQKYVLHWQLLILLSALPSPCILRMSYQRDRAMRWRRPPSRPRESARKVALTTPADVEEGEEVEVEVEAVTEGPFLAIN